MHLVQDVVISWRFKVLEFTKYINVGYSKTHMRIYYSKIARLIKDDKLFIHFFYEILSGVTFLVYEPRWK